MRVILMSLSLLLSSITCTASDIAIDNPYWNKAVDTRKGLGDVSRFEIITDVGNQHSVWTFVKFRRKPYIFRYDFDQDMWIAHTNPPFDPKTKGQNIRAQSDGTLDTVAPGYAYRWDTDHWKKLAGNKIGLPKRSHKITTDVTNDGTAWSLVMYKRKKARLYHFDPEKNMWVAAGTVPLDPHHNMQLRAHSNNNIFISTPGNVTKWNSWRKAWNTIVDIKKGLPENAQTIMTDVARNGSAWAVATFKRNPSHLYRFDTEKHLWIPHAIVPFDKKDKDHNLHVQSNGDVFVTADTVAYMLR